MNANFDQVFSPFSTIEKNGELNTTTGQDGDINKDVMVKTLNSYGVKDMTGKKDIF